MTRPNDQQPMDRIPPQNVDLEMCVLGGIMLEPKDGYPLAAEILQPADFYLEGHALIFRIMGDLHKHGTPPDAQCVLDELRARGQLDKAGGSGVVMGMLNSIPTGANIDVHSQRVREKSIGRQALYELHRAMEGIFSAQLPTEDILNALRPRLDALVGSSNLTHDVELLAEASATEAKRLQAHYDAGYTGMPGVVTGWHWLDNQAGGYQPGDFWVIGARPNTGKSKLALFSAASIAAASEHIGYINLELGRPRFLGYALPAIANFNLGLDARALLARDMYFVQQWGEIEQTRLRDMCASNAHIQKHFRAVIEARSKSITSIRGWIRHMATECGCKVIFIDQLQQIPEFIAGIGDRRQFAETIWAFKQMAAQYKVCIVVLHQLGRMTGMYPTLEDLKETGNIEEYADMVLLLGDIQTHLLKLHGRYWTNGTVYRKVREDDNKEFIHKNVTNPRSIRMHLAKNRNDATIIRSTDFDFSKGVAV